MRTLTPEQWRVLTYIQEYTRKWDAAPKLGHICAGCVLPSKQYALKLITELSDYGLVRVSAKKVDGLTFWSAQLLPSKEMVGVAP